MSDVETRVAVVGGGIAGLTVALRLQQENADYRLIESERVLGGKVRTDAMDGFVIEGGPDSFLAEKPWARELCEELGIAGDIIGTNDAQRQTFLVSRGKLRPLPEGFVMLAPVKPFPLLRSRLISLPGVARMAIEPLIPARTEDDDESLGHFVRRRLGDEVFERIVDPLMSGIYAGDSDELSIESTFPRLRDLERKHKSIIRGLLLTQRQMKARPASGTSMFLSLRGGMAQMTDALVRRLDPARVSAETAVTSLARLSDRYRLRLSDGTGLLAETVVLATPAFVSATLLEDIDPQLSFALRQIPYVSTATVSMAFRRDQIKHPLNGFGFVIPRLERRRITACTWVSSKLPSRAPEGSVLLRCFIGRSGDEDWVGSTDAELVQRARAELGALMGVTAEPLFSRVFRWERSMPQYRVGHRQLLNQIDRRTAAVGGLFLTGSAYRGVGLPDVVKEANATAWRVIEAEKSRTPAPNAPDAGSW